MINFSSNTISNNLQHKRYYTNYNYNYNYLSNKTQINEKKKENINPVEQSIGLKTIKIDKNLDENNRNNYII